MIRLALAVGFLTVFGLVGYALVLLLTNYFKDKNEGKNNNQTNNH